jgi:hypothetical protein
VIQLRGRHWLLAWLGLFLAVATAVNLRQTLALRLAAEVRQLEVEARNLEAQRIDLEARIKRATGRRVLMTRAEREFGLVLPEGDAYRRIEIAPRGDD